MHEPDPFEALSMLPSHDVSHDAARRFERIIDEQIAARHARRISIARATALVVVTLAYAGWAMLFIAR